jgi:GT2 family glycosyltransferase
MRTPRLSVVIASVNGFPYLGRCLSALAERAPDAEVIVADCTDAETRRRVAEGWPMVKLLSFDEPTSVPALRAAGVFAASAPRVSVLEDHCIVLDGWEDALLRDDGEAGVAVGGPIRNRPDARIRDWAGFLFEYSAFLEPAERGPARVLPGMNVCYDRSAIEAIEDLLRQAKWESWLHGRLRERGFELRYEPDAVIEHDMDFGVGEFMAQRFHYARSYAAMRNPDLGRRRPLYALASPALIPLLYARVLANVLRAGRHRRELVLATPLLLLYTATTAAGEALGYAVGGGRSLLKVR